MEICLHLQQAMVDYNNIKLSAFKILSTCDLSVGQGGHILQSLGVTGSMGHFVHVGPAVTIVLGEEQDVIVVRVNSHSFTVIALVVRILDMDVLDFVCTDMNISAFVHLWLLKLVDCQRGPPVCIVSKVTKIDVAFAIFPVDSNVLPVSTSGAMQLHPSQPLTFN